MGRKKGTAKICVICGDNARGINFNAATCMSCKAFFRRNALLNKELKCPFNKSCKIEQNTRRFCSYCRLKKCFDKDMKKEWILTDEECKVFKEKIRLNKLKKQKDLVQQLKHVDLRFTNTESTSSSSSVSSPSLSFSSSSSSATILNSPASPCSVIVKNILYEAKENQELSPIHDELLSIEAEFSQNNQHDQNQEHDKNQGQDQPNQDQELEEDEDPLEINSVLGDYCEELLLQNSNAELSPISPLDLSEIDRLSFSSDTLDISNQLVPMSNNHNHKSFFDPILDFVPHLSGTNLSIYPELGLPNHELIIPELNLLRELSQASIVLQNPYRQIIEVEQMDPVYSSRITEYYFYRLIRMAKQLSCFNGFTRSDQRQLLKLGLIKMLSLRTVLLHNSFRNSWGFIDDATQKNVMIRMDFIRPFCTKSRYERHLKLPNLFREEWKQDTIIFDLLTAIVLFTPRFECLQNDRVRQEHDRYIRLLRRYLTMKYPTLTEAEDCFQQLLHNVKEMIEINDDIVNFMRSFEYAFLPSNPFFVELLDLNANLCRKVDPLSIMQQSHAEPVVDNTFVNAFISGISNSSSASTTNTHDMIEVGLPF